jgi:DNA-binding transcriptional ArsR family regulator
LVESQAGVDAVFHSLASEAQRDMLGWLADGELAVGQLAAPLSTSLAASKEALRVTDA